VTERNRHRILHHVSESGLFDDISGTIDTKLNRGAQKYLAAIENIQEVILEAIEADVSSMTDPDTTVFEQFPGFGEDIAEMVVYAGLSLEQLQQNAEQPIATALQRGYIQ